SSFIITSVLSLHSLSPAIRLFSLLPFPSPLLPFNSLLRSVSHFRFSNPNSLFPLFFFLQLLRNGISPNRHTFPPLLSFLSHRRYPFPAPLHSFLLKSSFIPSDPHVSSSLLYLYASSNHLPSALHLFDEIPRINKNLFLWTSLIASHNNAGLHAQALLVFERMQYSGIRPNRVTMICSLAACSALGALDMGVWIHGFVKRSKWEVDVVLGTALIDMYGKCGRIDEGVCVFESMKERNVYTWNAVIGGLARAKSGEKAVEWFFRMVEVEGVDPDEVTLVEVLRACSYSGLVEIGRKMFESICDGRYGFRAGIKHYGCMVDLLGRAGLLDEAMELIEMMPFEPTVVIWGSFLGGCRAHGNMRLSEIAAKRLIEKEPENAAHYVVLSNLYREMGRWRDAEELRRLIKERGMRKDAGFSFTGADDALETFG
ncbi:pentatricopeptide repeat-containing protein At3g28660-like, partial [Asparagus officinalis]